MPKITSKISRKRMERQSRRDFVVEAARRLFASRGVEDTSMEDIAAAVGYTRRTLYAYFRSRDEICLAVFTDDLRTRWAAQKEALREAATGLDKIRVWGEALYQYCRRKPESTHLQAHWDFRGIDRRRIGRKVFAEFEAINEELADGLREIFRLGVTDRTLRSDLNVDMCISQYLYSLRSVINRALSSGYSFAHFDPDKYVQAYLELFCRGISNSGGTT